MNAASQEARARIRRSAFTLVELMVAAAVFGLLVLMLGQVVSLTSQAVIINVGRLTTSAQVRLFFDRLALDLEERPRRTDLATTFNKATGNDSFQFYSQVDGYSGSRHMAAVAYRVQESNTTRYYELERGAAGIDWTSGSSTALLFLPQTPATPVDDDYEVLSTDIFRLEFCYLLNTGLLTNNQPGDFSTVAGIVVAVGALDSNSRKLLSQDQLKALSDDLPDNADGQDLATGWDAAIVQPNFGGANLPRAVRGAVKVFQRTFYVR